MAVECPDCDLFYAPDDPDDAAYHAKYHEEVTAPDRPKPDSQIAELADPVSGVIIIKRSNPDFLHKKLYRISCRFNREMGYDQPAWAQKGCQVESGAIGAMFCDQEGKTLGGAGIYTNTPYRDVSHMIGWVWIAPNYRRGGVLACALPRLAMLFPGALIQCPYSEAIERVAEASPYIINKGGLLYLIE